jgi:hypothetical protein
MTPFHLYAMALITGWLVIVGLFFRRSTIVLTSSFAGAAILVLAAWRMGYVAPREVGLGISDSWLSTVAFALVGLALMFAYSPVADRLATRWVAKPPTLGAFRALQQSKLKLILGIVVAWILGGFLGELVFRGIVLKSVQMFAAPMVGDPIAAAIAVCAAALGAGVVHLYQGPRAVLIIVQLSALFGLLFVVSGYNLLTVILCHGLYDTIAFVRFAAGKSKYSKIDPSSA